MKIPIKKGVLCTAALKGMTATQIGRIVLRSEQDQWVLMKDCERAYRELKNKYQDLDDLHNVHERKRRRAYEELTRCQEALERLFAHHCGRDVVHEEIEDVIAAISDTTLQDKNNRLWMALDKAVSLLPEDNITQQATVKHMKRVLKETK